MLDQATSDAIAALPCWSGPIEIEPLSGGITNRNFKVRVAGHSQYVVRFGHDIPEHGVLRLHERAAARAAHQAGLSPQVIHAQDGVLVSRFIDGRVMQPADVCESAQLQRIAALLRRCHALMPKHVEGPVLIFWVFQVVRNYLRFLATHHDEGALPLTRLAEKSQLLEAALGAVQMVFAHNDLLAANLLDDGSRLWLIDWEYAGFNTPLFDLANLATNNGLSPALEQQLLQDYFGTEVDAASRRGFAIMQCASLLRETLWGAVSHHTSTLNFDYRAYAQEHLRRFDAQWLRYQSQYG